MTRRLSLPLRLRKATEVRRVRGVPVSSAEMLLPGAMKMKPGLHWRPSDAGDATVMGYLAREN